jgi:sugar/nucleoside kinase (ribokinase family)
LDDARAHENHWAKILARIAPSLKGRKRWMFFDLADPAKRSRQDLAHALHQISRFQKYFRVILGMNLPESRQVGEVLGLKPRDETFATVTQSAALIQKRLKIETVVIHPTHFAAAADATNATYVEGPFTATPTITTGAGDHFNAGLLCRSAARSRFAIESPSRRRHLRVLRAKRKEPAPSGYSPLSARRLTTYSPSIHVTVPSCGWTAAAGN